MTIDIRIGDSRKLIHELPAESIDCVVTSPPYWGLRDYKTEPIVFDGMPDCGHEWAPYNRSNGGGHPTGSAKVGATEEDTQRIYGYKADFCSKCGAWRGQLGLEPTPEMFIKHLLDFFSDVKLKLKADGNVFVNLGDTYSGSGCGTNDYRTEKSKSINGKGKNAVLYKTCGVAQNIRSVPAKSLCMIPQRFAWGMIERGWILRNEIIWAKPNHMPESVTDRLTKAHEVIYHFVRSKKYYYNLNAIREPLTSSSIERISQKTIFEQTGGLKQESLRGNPDNGNASRCNKMVQSLALKARKQRKNDGTDYAGNGTGIRNHSGDYNPDGSCINNPLGKNPGDVWIVTLHPYPESHFAVFPLELVRRPILAGCPPGGDVLDPFAGSGTVGEFCRHNDRNAILFELNPEYGKLIRERTIADTPEIGSFFC